MNTAAVVMCGLGFGLGVVGIASCWWVLGFFPPSPMWGRSMARFHRRDVMLAGLAAAVGLAAGFVTGWPAAMPIAALGSFGLPKLFSRTASSASISKIEAIATWTEMLQSTLAASAGLGQAIITTAPLSPLPIRGATSRLSSRLGAGMHPRDALHHFADEVDDPSADRVVCALQLAVSARAQRLGELLATLADSTREEVSLRLRIETSRASIRSGVRTVVVFSVLFAATLTLLARTYLQPFDSAQGQLALLGIGALYATGLWLMVSLARPPAPVRMLGRGVTEQ